MNFFNIYMGKEVDRKEIESFFQNQSEQDKLSLLVNMSEAFNAIQDEANTLALIDNIPEEVREGLDRIEGLARHQFDFRTEDEKKRTKSE